MPENSLLYTHRHFTFGVNNDQIVEVNMTASDPQLVHVNESPRLSCLTRRPVQFSYSCSWVASTVPFSNRFYRYFAATAQETQMHWFSIFNSFMIVAFLAGLVAVIMIRTLKMDYLRYSRSYADLGSAAPSDDYGWKRVHGDVFRRCPHLTAYCVFRGTGAHIAATLFLALFTIVLTPHYLGRPRIYVP